MTRVSSLVRTPINFSSSTGLLNATRVGQARRSDHTVHHETTPVATRTWPLKRYNGWKKASMSRKCPIPQSAMKAPKARRSPANGPQSGFR